MNECFTCVCHGEFREDQHKHRRKLDPNPETVHIKSGLASLSASCVHRNKCTSQLIQIGCCLSTKQWSMVQKSGSD